MSIIYKIVSLFNYTYNKIKDFINYIKMFFTKKRGKENRVQISDTEWIDTTDWIEVSNEKQNETVDDDVEDTNINHYYIDRYYLHKNEHNQSILKIFVPSKYTDTFEESQWVKTDMNSKLSIISNENYLCLYAKLNMFGSEIIMTAPHILNLFDELTTKTSYIINPQVVSTSLIKGNIRPKLLKHKKEATIFTKHVVTRQDYVIVTKPSMLINCPIMFNSKPIVATIGCIITIEHEHEMIWSGSLIRIESMLFIISMKKIYYDPDIIKLFAFAIVEHNYTAEIDDE